MTRAVPDPSPGLSIAGDDLATHSIDVARLSIVLNDLRLPAIKHIWPSFAERADREGWPAARFLAALAEHEIAERARRRIERHLGEARLPPGKSLDSFDFDAVPMVSKARIMALVAGDSWLEKGANLILFGPPGGGKSHLAAAIGLGLIENGWRVFFTRTTDLVQKLQVARRELALEAAINRLDKFHLLILDDPLAIRGLRHQGPGRDQRALRAHQRPIRTPLDSDHRQPTLRRMEQDLSRPGHDAGCRRPAGPPRHHPRTQRRELPTPRRSRAPTRPRPTTFTRDNQNHP
jgi:hypothetical protein